MAKNMQPIAKRCKALGISPAEMGYAKKTGECPRKSIIATTDSPIYPP